MTKEQQFLTTLQALIRECQDRIAENAGSMPRKLTPEMAQYWQDRKQTLLECRALFNETIGGTL